MKKFRILLIAVGLLPLGWGLYGIAATVPPAQILGILLWLAGAVVLHDGFLVPVLLTIGAVTVLLTRRLSRAGRYLIRLALIIGGSVLLVVLPLIHTAPHTGTPTALTMPYTLNLLVFLLVLAAATAVGVLIAENRQPGTKSGAVVSGTKDYPDANNRPG
ncbi:hypothetical protein IV498_10475 [Paenarthrobacter sp. Z7-10]|uniref:hypothetical protein n=1 Tax=Paenarthrobacter sp. Z7-10 TaxID=2787635 RepID=UPI0022A93337|nr:hypothetical protein [Paenarthrobacter sp. Z7-10]MCZ2403595.1 hypothetical protein [Paenarthrobacter sp. Z7-10]